MNIDVRRRGHAEDEHNALVFRIVDSITRWCIPRTITKFHIPPHVTVLDEQSDIVAGYIELDRLTVSSIPTEAMVEGVTTI
jgi:hypothetical protein